MKPYLTVFIDEAGDPGTKDGLHYLPGRHEWFCVSAVAVRTTREGEVVEWVRELRKTASATQGNALHYAKVTKERRRALCEQLATKPLRAFCLASHKSNLREYENPRLGRFRQGKQYYNWCVRLLLERLTEWAAEWHEREGVPATPMKIVFAERGGHDYRHMFAYVDLLRAQLTAGTLVLKGRGLQPPFLDRTFWEVQKAEALAGLQLADTIASAVYQAANGASPSWDSEPARTLLPIFPKDDRGCAANFGLTVWPLPHQGTLPADSQSFFEHFGYRF